MKSKQKILTCLTSLVALAAGVSLLTSCSGNADASAGTEGSPSAACAPGLSLGFIGALTGANHNLNANIRNGVQLAVTQHNAANGACQVKITDYDSLGEGRRAETVAKQAVADPDVIGVVGPAFSGESTTADPVLDQGGLVGISASATSPALSTKGWKTFFRVVNNDWTQAPAAAAFLTKTLAKNRIYVVDDGTEYGKGMSDIVARTLTTSAVGRASIYPRQIDFSDVVEQVRTSNADAVFYGGYYAEAGLLLSQLRHAGLDETKVAFISDDAVKDDAFVTTAGLAAAEGAYITCPCLPPDKAAGTFYADYTAAYGSAPGTFAAEGYDAATVMLDGIEAGKITRSSLLSYVASYDKVGVTKNLTFDRFGEPQQVNVWAYQVRGGQIVPDKIITTDG